MKVSVTAERIRHGRRYYCDVCPVALAIKPHFPPELLIIADGFEVRVMQMQRGVAIPVQTAPLPEAARAFVRAFDKGQPVEPFEFELDLHPELFMPPHQDRADA